MKKHLLAIALFALCTTGLNAASPKKVTPEKKGVETINRATAEAISAFWPVTNWKDAKPDGKVDALQAIISFPA